MNLKPVKDWLKSKHNTVSTYCNGKWNEHSSNVESFHLQIDGNNFTIKLLKPEESDVFLTVADRWRDPSQRSVCFSKLHNLYASKDQLTVAATFETISTNTPIAVSIQRLEHQFLDFLTYYRDLGVYLNSVAEPKNFEVFMNAGASIMSTVANSVIPVLARGESIGLHVESSNIGTILLVSHFVDLCHKSGFPEGLIYFDFCQFRQRERVKGQYAMPVAVVCDNSDFHSAAERILELIIHRKRSVNTLLVFVQQSIWEPFEKRFKFLTDKMLVAGSSVFDSNINILEGYEMKFNTYDISEAIEDNNNTPKIHVYFFQYRTNEELLKLLNYIPEMRFLSLWTEDVPLALEIGEKVKKCPLVWINSMLNYHPSVAIDDRFFEFYLIKPLKVNEYDSKTISTFENSLQAHEKWATLSVEQRLKLIYSNIKCVFESLRILYDRIRVVKHVSSNVVITVRKPIGIVVFEPSEAYNSELLELIALCLLSGNSIILLTDPSLKGYETRNDYLKNFPQKLIQFVDKTELDFLSEYNAYVILNEKEVGICFRNATANEAIDLNELIECVTRPKTVWFPNGGGISYAV